MLFRIVPVVAQQDMISEGWFTTRWNLPSKEYFTTVMENNFKKMKDYAAKLTTQWTNYRPRDV